jgi:hypothetical protein
MILRSNATSAEINRARLGEVGYLTDAENRGGKRPDLRHHP